MRKATEVRICKSCGKGFEWDPEFKKPFDHCPSCRRGTSKHTSVRLQEMRKWLPGGKYVVVKCVHGGMIGNVIRKGILARSACEGHWPDGMMVFNLEVRRVYRIQGEEGTPQKILNVSDPPETVKRRIKSSYSK